MKIVGGTILLSLLSVLAVAQPLKSPPKTIAKVGMSGFGFYDFCTLPIYDYYSQEYYNEGFVSLFTVSMGVKRNLLTFDDHKALSLSFEPSAGTILSWHSHIDIRYDLPLLIGMNWGAGATQKSISTKGFGLNLGICFTKGGILSGLYDRMFDLSQLYNHPVPMLCASMNFRKWTSKGNLYGECREVEVLFAIGQKNGYQPLNPEAISLSMPMRISVLFNRFLNY